MKTNSFFKIQSFWLSVKFENTRKRYFDKKKLGILMKTISLHKTPYMYIYIYIYIYISG